MERQKVLIGDGSTFMRIMLRNVLERLGFEVVAACRDCKEMLDKYRETKASIVLVDIALNSQMDSLTLIRTIATNDPLAIVIALLPEGVDEQDAIVEVVRAGAKGFIRKPLSAAEIERRMERILRRPEVK